MLETRTTAPDALATSALEGAKRTAASLNLPELFQLHHGSMWRLLQRLGVHEAALDDAAQEVFWIAARRLADIRPGSEHAFLYGVALRIAAQHVHRQRAALRQTGCDELEDVRDSALSPEEHLEQRQARELLQRILDRLPLELRSVLVLFELEGLAIRDIAEIESIPVGTVSSRLRRAREDFALIAQRLQAQLLARTGGRR